MISSSSTKSLAPHISRTQKQIAAALLWIGWMCCCALFVSFLNTPKFISG